MLRKKKHGDKVTNFEIRPPSPTIDQMIEDVEQSDPSDFIFTTNAHDTDATDNLVGDVSDDDDEEFYETRTSFETNPSILYETIDERFGTMCKIIKLNDELMVQKETVQDTFDELAAAVESVKSLKDKLKKDISDVIDHGSESNNDLTPANESPDDVKDAVS